MHLFCLFAVNPPLNTMMPTPGMKKRIRKIALWAGGILTSLVLLLGLLGYFFEDEIHLYAIQQLGKALNARIEVKDTDVSFLRSFPSVQVELEGLTINPVDEHQASDVISIEQARLTVDFWSMFSDHYQISKVSLHQPQFWMEYDKEGNLNFADMFQTPEDSSEGSEDAFELALRQVSIVDGTFRYRDMKSGFHVRLDSIHMVLDGDFKAQQTDLDADFALRIDHWHNGRITWFSDKHLSAEALIDANFAEETVYKLKQGVLHVEDVDLALKGGLSEEGKAYRINLNFDSNESSFKSFLSLLPGGLLNTGREYDYSGEFKAQGYVQGRFSETETPNIHLDYSVRKGSFQYVGYDAKLSDVNLKGLLHWDSKKPELSELKVHDFTAKLRGKELSGHIRYADFRDPLLEFKLLGDLDLQDIRDFYPQFADSTDLRGLIRSNLEVEARIAAIREKRHQDIRALGTLAFDSVRIADPRLQSPVERLKGQIVLDNHRVQVNQLAGRVGRSDFDAKGMVTDYLTWFLSDTAKVKAVLEVKSKRVDANEWFKSSSQTSVSGRVEDRFVFTLPQGIDFQARVDVGDFIMSTFQAKNVRGNCRMRGKEVVLESLTMQAMDGNLQVGGNLTVERPDRCKVRIDALAADIDINKTFKTFNQLAAFALVEDHLFGRFSGQVNLSGFVNQYLDLDAASLVSMGSVTMKGAKLVDFEPLTGLAGFVKMDELKFVEFSDVSTSYKIQDSYFYIPGMKVKANRYMLDVSGKHGFDNSLDYKVLVEMPRKEAQKSRNQRVLEYIDTEQPDPVKVVIPVRITGTVDNPKFALEGDYVASKAKESVQKQQEDLKKGWEKESEDLFGPKKDTFALDDLIEVKKTPKDSSKKSVFDKLKDPIKKVKLPNGLGGQR